MYFDFRFMYMWVLLVILVILISFKHLVNKAKLVHNLFVV
jgi:hypothetical protein